MAIRIAIDAMGGDHAPSAVIEGVVRAVQRRPDYLEVILCGPQERLQDELTAQQVDTGLPISIADAPDVIGMDDAPTVALKTKPRSSIHVGLGMHKAGKADAFISAGNTGAVMAASLCIIGRDPHVARPSVIAYFPTTEGNCILLDAGANIDSRAEHLVQFAQMGSIYAQRVMKRENPVVALLNVGEEPGKGTEMIKTAYELLRNTPDINFRGNIEGRDLLHHSADVVVCDGFIGNILLKFGESVSTVFTRLIEQEAQKLALSPEEANVIRKVLKGIHRRFDFEEYGGAPLLGITGNVVIGHGSSSSRAFERMVDVAATLVEQEVAVSIAETINQ